MIGGFAQASGTESSSFAHPHSNQKVVPPNGQSPYNPSFSKTVGPKMKPIRVAKHHFEGPTEDSADYSPFQDLPRNSQLTLKGSEIIMKARQANNNREKT